MMLAGKHLRWNVLASIITIVVLIGFGLRGGAFFQFEQQEEAPATATSEAASSEHASEAEHGDAGQEAESHFWDEVFHWTNFILIVLAIGYMGKKFLAPFLAERSQAIRKDMEDSARARQRASERLAGVENKLKQLDEEIVSLRSSALQEAAADQARIVEQAKTDAGKIAANAQQEIAAATKIAIQELKAHTAELAVGLAEKKIRDSISP
ncbi:MAG: ATP synthase F0 subunit B, partial [Acidobacteria bacterium]|nr:ATP synthase F0 subunit B [Acidobacteriota bacterium]